MTLCKCPVALATTVATAGIASSTPENTTLPLSYPEPVLVIVRLVILPPPPLKIKLPFEYPEPGFAIQISLTLDDTINEVLLTTEFTVRISPFTATLEPVVNTPREVARLNLVFVPVTVILPLPTFTVPAIVKNCGSVATLIARGKEALRRELKEQNIQCF